MKIKEDITVNGMSCKHCVKAVSEAVKDLDGVKKVKVDLEDKRATVEYDDQKVNLETIKAAITEAGYTAV
ncbi:MAG: copper ion binding protein [Ethanoligenens sp.]|uniref:heavy-metal-associated domain-containing protein n=1 Tax=Ethanoligenens sp. TaxID=2099655 RepID=UPI0039E9FAEB